MKRIILLFVLALSFATAKAQTYVVTTTNGNNQVQNTYFAQGFDSTSIASATNVTIPSGYFVFTQQLYKSAAVAWKDTITLPTSPTEGQQVNIVSNVKLYHLFVTVPANVLVDSAGIQEAVLIYDATLKKWKLIH